MLILREKDLAVLCKIIKESFPDSFQVWTYGSRVDGTAHDASDLDLVIRSADLSPIDFDIMEGFRESLRNSNIPV
jgi:predicted nucleotidyltransferase